MWLFLLSGTPHTIKYAAGKESREMLGEAKKIN